MQTRMRYFRYGRTNGESLPVRKMIAKFDYDSRQLSPNVDAEQVSFIPEL